MPRGLFLLFLFFVSLSAHAEGLTVLLYGDDVVFPRARLGREIRFLEKNYGRDVLAYPIDSADELKQTLLFLTRTKIPIHNLVVHGLHGGQYNSIPFWEVADLHDPNRIGDYVGFADLKKMGVSLNFDKEAFLFFDSCSMINTQSEKTVITAFNEVKKIGFKSGWMYLNSSDGNDGVANTFTVPFYKVAGGWRLKAGVLAGQAIWPLTLPLFYYRDHYVMNQGYLYYTPSNTSSANKAQLLKTNAFKAIKNSH